MAERSVHEAAVEAVAGALYEDVNHGWTLEECRQSAVVQIDALVRSEAVRAALADVGATALVADWNSRPYVGQTAQKDAETVVAAILAALGGGES